MKLTGFLFSAHLRAFSSVEILLTLMVLGILGSVGYGVYDKVVNSARETKAQSDIATLNRAVTVYLASGGNIDPTAEAEQVIRKLKSREFAEKIKFQVGLTGTKIDPRLVPVYVEEDEEKKSGARISWNAQSGKFEYNSDATGPGIAYFELDESAPIEIIEEELDDGVFSYAKKSNWIWDYEESGPVAPSAGPSTFTTSNSPPTTIPSTPPPSPSTPPTPTSPPPAPSGPLNPPVFSISGGTHPLSNYRLNLTLNDPNPAGAGTLLFRTNGGSSWAEYTAGSSIQLNPNDTVDAYVATKNSSAYKDSTVEGNSYWSTPVTLNLDVSVDRASVTYYDLVEGSIFARAKVTNTGEIPAYLQTPGLYEIKWSLGGTEMSTQQNGNEILALLGPGLWASNTGISLSAQADASGSQWVKSSNPETVSISANPLDLPVPNIQLNDLGGGRYEVELTHSGKIPAGTEIYYNLDGSPLTAGATPTEPPNGTLYGGTTFVWEPDTGSATLNVAAFPPAGLDLWFSQSGTATRTMSPPPAPGPGSPGGMALVKDSMTLDGKIIGGIRNLRTSSLMINATTDITGDIALSGTPSVTINGSPDFSGVSESNGPPNPSGYSVIVNSGAQFGSLVTRSQPVPFPTLNDPPSSSGSWITIDSPTGIPSNWFPNSGVNLNSNAGSVSLPPGTYGTFNASNSNSGGEVVLGNSNGTPAVYNFQTFTLNSGVPLRITGPVTINTREFTINGGSQVGNAGTQDKLTINVSGNRFIDNLNGTLYAKSILVANGTAYINGTVHAGITTKNLTVNQTGTLHLKKP